MDLKFAQCLPNNAANFRSGPLGSGPKLEKPLIFNQNIYA